MIAITITHHAACCGGSVASTTSSNWSPSWTAGHQSPQYRFPEVDCHRAKLFECVRTKKEKTNKTINVEKFMSIRRRWQRWQVAPAAASGYLRRICPPAVKRCGEKRAPLVCRHVVPYSRAHTHFSFLLRKNHSCHVTVEKTISLHFFWKTLLRLG